MGSGALWFVFEETRSVDRLAQATTIQVQNNSNTLAHQSQVIDDLQRIEQEHHEAQMSILADLKTDIAVLTFRLNQDSRQLEASTVAANQP